MSTEKIIVVKSIAEEFRKELVATANNMQGMSGPSAMEAGVTKVQGLIDDAVKKGGKLEFGENKRKGKQHLNQMIIGNVTKDMDIYHQETFGPVSALIVVNDVEEAIRVANDTEFGLSASIFSKDLSKALQVARRIESGAVHINGKTVHDENSLPHGGTTLIAFTDFRMEKVWIW
jgi:acyl-CoA reductase-like NAD-dependent aldehyde dehydrogenase